METTKEERQYTPNPVTERWIRRVQDRLKRERLDMSWPTVIRTGDTENAIRRPDYFLQTGKIV